MKWEPLETLPIDKPTLQLVAPATGGSDNHLSYLERIVAVEPYMIRWNATHWMPIPNEPEYD